MTITRDRGEGAITVYIGLGSNLGDREANLREASSRIQELIKIVRQSSIFETEPVGLIEQPWFLNQVIEGILPLDAIQAQALLSELLKIENDLGRERTIVNGPRLIDIDLLLFGDSVINQSKEDTGCPGIDQIDLVVPHPRMHTRRFVLEPLCEIAPELVHPIRRKSFREILAALDDASIVRRYDPARAGP